VQGPSFPISGGQLAHYTRSRRHAKDRFTIGLIVVVRVAVVEIHIPCVARVVGLRGRGPEPKDSHSTCHLQSPASPGTEAATTNPQIAQTPN
jgi:hypothetical protein